MPDAASGSSTRVSAAARVELHTRDGVAGQAGDDRRDEGHQHRRHQAVAQPQRKARGRPQYRVVVPGEGLWHVDARGELDLLVGLERHAGDPPERHEHDQEEGADAGDGENPRAHSRSRKRYRLTSAMATISTGTRKIETVTPRPQRSWLKATSYE